MDAIADVGAIADDPAVVATGETPGPERVADVDVMMQVVWEIREGG